MCDNKKEGVPKRLFRHTLLFLMVTQDIPLWRYSPLD